MTENGPYPPKPLGGSLDVKKRGRSIYPLPSAKLATNKQFLLLKAFAIASGEERKAVTLTEVAKIQDIHSGSVSMCNPFFDHTKLIEKQGHKFTTSKEVLAYSQRLEWSDPDAGKKLAPLIRETWFAEALVPRLRMAPMTEELAIQVLSDVSKARSSEKRQLVMLLDYLEHAGIIARDGAMLRLVKELPAGNEALSPFSGDPVPYPTTNQPPPPRAGADQPVVSDDYESLSIPIPGYPNALIEIPKDMEAEDWQFFRSTLDSYLNRLQKRAGANQKNSQQEVGFFNNDT